MESTNQIFILGLIGICFLVIGLLSGFVAYLFLKNREKDEGHVQAEHSESKVLPELLTKCDIHNDVDSKGSCSICNSTFCETCLIEVNGLNFCPSHIKIFSENKWVSITNLKTTPDKPEAATFIYNFKDEQWCSYEVPSYIVTHYKINFEEDFIESYVMLYVRSQDEDLLRNKLPKIN